MAEQMLSTYNFDQAFIGATGLDLTQGTVNVLIELSQVMARVSREVFVMAESEK
jgi:DeoR/GlpR family transcriptional regulator of sugar metabolism